MKKKNTRCEMKREKGEMKGREVEVEADAKQKEKGHFSK